MDTQILSSGVCKVVAKPIESDLLECFHIGDLYLYKKKKGPLTFYKWSPKLKDFDKITKNVTYYDIENKDKPTKSLKIETRVFSKFFIQVS
jgi:hypothetical protein